MKTCQGQRGVFILKEKSHCWVLVFLSSLAFKLMNRVNCKPFVKVNMFSNISLLKCCLVCLNDIDVDMW